MRKKVVVRINDRAFNSKASFSVMNFLTAFNRGCHSSRIYEGATVWHCSEFMNGTALANIKRRLTLSCNEANRSSETLTTYAKKANDLRRR